jgi:hypothetical protein
LSANVGSIDEPETIKGWAMKYRKGIAIARAIKRNEKKSFQKFSFGGITIVVVKGAWFGSIYETLYGFYLLDATSILLYIARSEFLI